MSDQFDAVAAALADRYTLLRELGAGGMATVYLAEDLKHDRKVAIKVLRPELAAVLGAERFIQEIKTTANLQHPNILPLFDSGKAGAAGEGGQGGREFLFYVMPYVEGETLRDKLNRETQLGIDEAVRLTTEVAEALDYAHRHGVIHRDIKPENILLHDGRPLVADFGIALAVSAAAGGRMTETGLSLGTPHYMSPEQATAEKELTARSDIYSLGAVLYEMLTGDPPHTGSSAQQIIMKIVTEEAPPVTKARRAVPANVAAALAQALEKLPADRFASAGAFRDTLHNPHFSRTGTGVSPSAGAGSRQWRAIAAGLAVVAVATGVVGAWAIARHQAPDPVRRFVLTYPLKASGNGLTISNDGRYVLVRGSAAGGPVQLHLRDLKTLTTVPIRGTEGAETHFRTSPDGSSVAFTAGGRLLRVPLTGGEPRTLVNDSVQGRAGAGLDWASDGMIYFRKLRHGIWRVPEGGGEPQMVTALAPGEADHSWFDVTPDADVLLYAGGVGLWTIEARSLRSGDTRTIWSGTADARIASPSAYCQARYAGGGYVLFLNCAGQLLAARIDLTEMRVTSSPVPVVEGLKMLPTGFGEFAISSDGHLLYRQGEIGDRARRGEIVWMGPDGTTEPIDPVLSGVIEVPRLSPDGARIAFDRTERGRTDIWIYDREARTQSRLTELGTVNVRPAWSPDGTEILFVNRDEEAIYAQPWDRSAPARMLRSTAQPGNIIWEGHLTSNGRWLVFREIRSNTDQNIYYAAPHPDSARHTVVDDETTNSQIALSPDDRWIAHRRLIAGRNEVVVRAFPGPGAQITVSLNGGHSPRWSHDGRRLFYIDTAEDVWTAAAVSTEGGLRILARQRHAPTEGFARTANIPRYDVGHDTERLLAVRYIEQVEERDVIVLNFVEELRERVGN